MKLPRIILLAPCFTALLACTPPSKGTSADAGPAAPARRYGEAMSEMGRRFELAGRAAAAGRFELARFELDELEELIEEDLPRAASPKVGAEVDLAGLTRAFATTNLRELARAADGGDRSAFAAAFERASAACNGCHAATKHGFIEIAPELTAAVPRLDPAPTTTGRDGGPM